MEQDVQLEEPGHVPGLPGVAHGVRDLHEFAAELLGGVGRGQLGGHRLDGGAELGQGAQLGAAALAGQPPADHERVEGVPPVRGQHPDADAFDGLHQAQGLEDPDRLPDHRAGDLEFVLKVLGKHDVPGRKLAGHDPGPEVLNGTVVEAG